MYLSIKKVKQCSKICKYNLLDPTQVLMRLISSTHISNSERSENPNYPRSCFPMFRAFPKKKSTKK